MDAIHRLNFSSPCAVPSIIPRWAKFAVNGAAQSGDKALTTASGELKWMSGFSLTATFEGEFAGKASPDICGEVGAMTMAWNQDSQRKGYPRRTAASESSRKTISADALLVAAILLSALILLATFLPAGKAEPAGKSLTVRLS